MRLKSLRGLIPIAVLLGIWQLVGNPHSLSTPAPSAWWPALKTIEQSGQLWIALKTTLLIFVEGLAIAIVLGVAVGVALGASRHVTQALGPLLEFLRATPAAVIVPGAILLLKANNRTAVIIVVYGSIWPILLNTASARAALSPLRLDMARTLGMSWWERMRKVVLPSLVPEITVGVRVAAPICLIVTLLTDYLIATGGLGYILVQYQEQFQAAEAFAMIAVIGIVGISINLLLGSAERVVLRRWPRGALAQ
ncbi:MAG TPA: ABC transporter permease [Solirubrobacteraceae bacterium]|jgi:ABC-type nitrate/sulfonate/bicarbonate transport system permease component|nr:ABC transporter permease [Solirubrobacteraceae bacterium]